MNGALALLRKWRSAHRHEWEYWYDTPHIRHFRRCATCGAFQQYWADRSVLVQGWLDIDPEEL